MPRVSVPLPGELELDIHALGGQGDAIGRLPGGEILLVDGAVPGDRVRVRLLGKRRGVQRGQVVAVVTPSPDRVTPACPVAGRCGGCDWQHVGLALQRSEKMKLAQHALGRPQPGQPPPPTLQVDDHGAPFGWRRRVRVHVREVAGRLQVGMMARASDQIVATTACPILEPALEAFLLRLPRALQPYMDQGEVYATAGVEGIVAAVHGRPRQARQEAVDAEALAAELAIEGLSLQMGTDASRWGLTEVTLPETAGGMPVTVDASGFCQASAAGNAAIRAAVVAAVAAIGPIVRADEFFAGSGNFSTLLVGRVQELRTVEWDHAAVARARKTLAPAADLGTKCTILFGDVADLAGPGADLWLLDPGRPGARDLVEHAGRCRPRHVIYVSCALDTLARDLRVLTAAGYVQQSATLVDTFPHTPHAEMIVRLALAG